LGESHILLVRAKKAGEVSKGVTAASNPRRRTYWFGTAISTAEWT
jgi:hypothetical protein